MTPEDVKRLLEQGTLNEVRTFLFEFASVPDGPEPATLYLDLLSDALEAFFERGVEVGRREAHQDILEHSPASADGLRGH